LPKIAENDLNLRQIDKKNIKGTKKGAKVVFEGLLRAAGEKSIKKVAKVQF
jgi:molybdopterin synthase catalytic subunit